MNYKHNRIKIAFLTSRDPIDRRSWSGTYYYMAKALQKHCGDVTFLGPIESKLKIIGQFRKKISRLLLRKNYNYAHSIFLAKRYAKIIAHKISKEDYDLIFAPAASSEIAFLNTKIPIIYLSDTTFTLMVDYYPEFSNLLNVSIREGNIIEELAIKKASLVLYPSEWAAQSALKDYHADEARIHVIPFGANLEDIPPKEIILEKKKSGRCKLLFLGVNWQRKGGSIAFETLLELVELGIQSELVVCGCTPPKAFSHKRMNVIPFLDKNDEEQRKELTNLFLTSDFLLLPTRSECSGIAFCEANAFGLPVITTNTGGVAGTVKDGENGFMLPMNARGSDYAKIIHGIYQDDKLYSEMVKSSRKTFDERLNWDIWAITVRELITKIPLNINTI